MTGPGRGAWVLVCVLAGCWGDAGPALDDPLAYPDVLDLTGSPDSARDNRVSAFADLGAWHMFGLPGASAGDAPGGFTGPLLLTDGGIWLGRSLVGLAAWSGAEGAPLVWAARSPGGVASYPGRLHQELSAGEVDATLDLVFVSERSALVRALDGRETLRWPRRGSLPAPAACRCRWRGRPPWWSSNCRKRMPWKGIPR